MKRKSLYILTIIAIISLCACNKQEIFSPNRYIETEKFQSASSPFEVIKQFTYSEKKQLTSVWMKEGNTTLTFEYNKDKTIKKINSSEMNNSCYAELFYDNKLVTHIYYYEDNRLARESIFSRKEKKKTISKIENYVYDGFSSKREHVLSDFLFPETKNMPDIVRNKHKATGKALYSVQEITYEKDNISRVRLSFVIDGQTNLYSTTSYNYDNKNNPYYGLPYAFMQLTGYSKNNETYARTSFENDKYRTMITIESSYSYEKKYPTNKSVVKSETYAVSFDANGLPSNWATDNEYSTYQYTYK
ncbi:MAG: hypothetical protein LBG80_19380 [Bacteroidales bacterium]|jgi:hypothetical protein|nr:hypothetical protein [Bacteroidales bacterium]